jgi:hypothetical protein
MERSNEQGEDGKVFKETEIIQIADEMQHTNTPAGLIGLLFNQHGEDTGQLRPRP